jgi:sugar lactone lactonase YvrE
MKRTLVLAVMCICVANVTHADTNDSATEKCGQKMATQKIIGIIEPVACFYGAMPTGVTVSHNGRIFVNFPRWGDNVEFTIAEVVDGKTVPYPDAASNNIDSDLDKVLVSVQSVVIDPNNRLWALDTGRIEFGPPKSPKLVCIDLQQNKVTKSIKFPENVCLPESYLNDVRFDLRRGKEGAAFITDSSGKTPGIIVVDLESGKSWRKLHKHPSTMPLPDFVSLVEGSPLMERKIGADPKPLLVGADGLAISKDGNKLYYCPLSSWALYSVDTAALWDEKLNPDSSVKDEGSKVASDGLESDSSGNIYVTSYDHNAILKKRSDGQYETIVCNPSVIWPDTLSLATDGYLYFTANQLNRQSRFHNGKDMREKPYMLFRVKVDEKPVLLK